MRKETITIGKNTILSLVALLSLAVVVGTPETVFAQSGTNTDPHPVIKKRATPDSCFFVNESYNQQSIYVGSTKVGYYDAFVQANTCQNTNGRVGTDVYVTSGSCTGVTMLHSYTINGGPQTQGSQNGTLGPNGCANGESMIWFSGSQVGAYHWCICNHITYNGVGLSPDAYTCWG